MTAIHMPKSVLLLSAASLMSLAGTASAQTAPDQPAITVGQSSDLADVIVTADRRAENQQNVPCRSPSSRARTCAPSRPAAKTF